MPASGKGMCLVFPTEDCKRVDHVRDTQFRYIVY